MQGEEVTMTPAWGPADRVRVQGKAQGREGPRMQTLGSLLRFWRALEVLTWVTSISALEADQGAMGGGLGG